MSLARRVEALVACAWYYVCQALAGDPSEAPGFVKEYLEGVTLDNLDYSNAVNLVYFLSSDLAQRIYGVKGLIALNSVISANKRPMASQVARAYNEGLAAIGEDKENAPFLYCKGSNAPRLKYYCRRVKEAAER